MNITLILYCNMNLILYLRDMDFVYSLASHYLGSISPLICIRDVLQLINFIVVFLAWLRNHFRSHFV